jgi:hypothetical protein
MPGILPKKEISSQAAGECLAYIYLIGQDPPQAPPITESQTVFDA